MGLSFSPIEPKERVGISVGTHHGQFSCVCFILSKVDSELYYRESSTYLHLNGMETFCGQRYLVDTFFQICAYIGKKQRIAHGLGVKTHIAEINLKKWRI